MDPLAVLISKVTTMPIDHTTVKAVGERVAERALVRDRGERLLPWIDDDPDTRAFVDFWFAPEQQQPLRSLILAVLRLKGPIRLPLMLAISRLIITKNRGASLARDVSHSRPHRVRHDNDFDVIEEFRRASALVARWLASVQRPGTVAVRRGNALRLPHTLDGRVDVVVTSPPYVNAIDYLRGHRLALVWLGYRLQDLTAINRRLVGNRRKLQPAVRSGELLKALGPVDGLDSTLRRLLYGFTRDIVQLLRGIRRVLKSEGRAVLVVGNSILRGLQVDNAAMIAAAGASVGLQEVDRYDREIPASHRYLPPPSATREGQLDKRMRVETVLVLEKP